MNSDQQQPLADLADASATAAAPVATAHDSSAHVGAAHGGAAHGAGTAAQTEGDAGGRLFGELLGHLNDTHQLHFLKAHVPLPYMFWDKDGFHFFSSPHAVDESAVYMTERKPEMPEEPGKAMRRDGQPISFDISITANVIFLALGALLIFLAARSAAKQSKKSLVPKGLHNVMESLVLFIRDQLVYPNIDRKYAEPLLPFFVSIFMFILVLNILGLIPFGRSATASLSVTAALALCTFFVTQYVAFKSMGFGGFMKHLTGGILDMNLNIGLKILLVLIMIPIEILGLFTKPFALAMRLFANMTAGHVIIVCLIGLAMMWGMQGGLAVGLASGFGVSVPFALFIYVLELLVVFIQAYVFTMLSALFIGMAIHEHHHDDEAHSHGDAAHTASAH